ncbi:hypothetical protein HOG98_02760 [bacterium]|jgi:exonuclease VII small subunit|nr:hypothetical protein [bacterium]
MSIEKKVKSLELLLEEMESVSLEDAVKKYGKAIELSTKLKKELNKVESSFSLIQKQGEALVSEKFNYDD